MYLDYALQDEFAAEDYQVLAADAKYIGRILSELKGTDDYLGDHDTLARYSIATRGSAESDQRSNGEIAAAFDDSRWLAEVGSSSAVHGRPVVVAQHDGSKWRLMRWKSKLEDAECTPVDIVVAIDITAREQFASRYRSPL